MRKLPMILSFFSFIFTIQLLQANVPQSVKVRFERLYPEVENPKWNYHNGEIIVATFTSDKGINKAFFDTQGDWLQTRLHLSKELLPKNIRHFIENLSTDEPVTFSGIVYNESGSWFRVESRPNASMAMRTFDEKGKLIEDRTVVFSIEFEDLADRRNIILTRLPGQKKPVRRISDLSMME